MIEEQNKKYWLILSPQVYTNIRKNRMLMYNTGNGEYLETDSPAYHELIAELQKSANLGVIAFDRKHEENVEISGLVSDALQKDMLKLIPIEEGCPKPMVLLPVLNLQRDVDKLADFGHEYFIGRDVLLYLHRLDIHINSSCGLNCHHCDSYYKQFLSCTKQRRGESLSPDSIYNILYQSQFSNVKTVNILGGDLYRYDKWDQLWDVLDAFDFEYHFWVHLNNIPCDKTWMEKALKHTMEIIISPDTSENQYKDAIGYYGDNPNIRLNCIIESEDHYNLVESLMKNAGGSERINIIPFYNGSNYDFFEENIFMGQEDILAEPIEMRTIFCNQKLNSNFFGNLTIMPEGDVRANVNTHVLGNIHTESFVKMIYDEMITKSSWRNVRGGRKCSECLYQYLCPPPSDYEFVLGRENLCRVE